MFSQTSALLEAGLALKTRQLKLAARSYLDDRTAQGKGVFRSYLLAVGFFAAAGIFMISACLVGVIALYRWIELSQGQFIAFGCIAGLLLVLTAICAALAASRLKGSTRNVPSLASRLIAAIKTNPVRLDEMSTAKGNMATPRTWMSTEGVPLARRISPPHIGRNINDGRALLLAAAILLSWAVARNRIRSRQADM
jgi:hypothetical protein